MMNNERYYYNKARKNLLSLEIEVQRARQELAGARMRLMSACSGVFGPKEFGKVLGEINSCERLTRGNADKKYGKTIIKYFWQYDNCESYFISLKRELKEFDIYMEMERLGYNFDIYGLSEEPIYK